MMENKMSYIRKFSKAQYNSRAVWNRHQIKRNIKKAMLLSGYLSIFKQVYHNVHTVLHLINLPRHKLERDPELV